MKRFLLILTILLCATQLSFSQEDGVVSLDIPVRSSLKFNRYLINPTFSFVREQNTYINITNKREWSQFEDAPQTFLINYSGRYNENMGVGVGLFQQNYGVLTTFGGILNFAYNARLQTDSNLTFGLNLGFYKSSLNDGNVIINQPDPSLENIPNNMVLSASPGINYGMGFLDFGVAVNNLVQYNFTSSELIEDDPQQGIQVHAMYTGFMYSRGFFDQSKFTALIKSEFQKEQTIVSGMAMLSVPKGIWAQVGYNSVYGLMGGLGINITKQIAVEYNYEKAMGDLATFGSSHEFTLAYKFKSKERYDYSGDEREEALLIKDQKKKPAVSTKPALDAEARAQLAEEKALEREAAQEASRLAIEARAIERAEAQEQARLDGEAKAQAQAQPTAEEKAQLEEEALAQAEAAEALAQERVAQEEAEEEARVEAVLSEEARLSQERIAQAQAAEQARIEALAVEEARLEALAVEEARLAAEQAAQAEANEQARLVAEAEEQARLEALAVEEARLAAEQAAQAQATEQARLAAEAEEQARLEALAIEEARLAAEQATKAQAAEQARLAAEAEANEQARIEALAIEEARLAAEAASQARLLAEAEALEKARLQALAVEEARLAALATKQVETEISQKDELAKSMFALAEESKDTKAKQEELLIRLNEVLIVKEKDLQDLKEENDLSEQGIYLEPKPFKSITAENRALDALKAELDNTISERNKTIADLEALYNQRIKKGSTKNDETSQYYLETIQALKVEQAESERAKANLVSTLESINLATEIERKRRIKRALYDNEKDRFVKDKAALIRIKENTPLSPVPLTIEDFNFGEEQTSNVQILKGVQNVDTGYYMIIAVHENVKDRDEFLEKMVASGQTNVNFFFDVNSSKYYIYYQEFDYVEEAMRALDNKEDKPYNEKMSVVKIEN